ncbi:MAG: hypothetical protein IPM53_32615 [Anaerolineaceae bacterium]|nr:hypothetical protein [Anaerolineaceae bacterium]
MDHQTQHNMILEVTHTSGAEEWVCPTCGRHLIVEWWPKFKKVVMDAGDEYAIHNGSKGGVVLSTPESTQPQSQIVSDELKSLLEDALKDIDFGD